MSTLVEEKWSGLHMHLRESFCSMHVCALYSSLKSIHHGRVGDRVYSPVLKSD